MKDFLKWLEELKLQVLGEQDAGQLDPIEQSVLGFLKLLKELFSETDGKIDVVRHTEKTNHEIDPDEIDRRTSTDSQGVVLFNNLQASANAARTWQTFMRDVNPKQIEVVHTSPLDDPYAVVTSPRGLRHGYMHHGIDIDTSRPDLYPTGKNPNAVTSADGVVLYTGYHAARTYKDQASGETKTKPNFGNVVIIGHSDGTLSVYAHLKNIDSDIKPGQMIKRNVILGEIGSTGGDMGVHLHYEQRKNGESFDPKIAGSINDSMNVFKQYGKVPDLAAAGVSYKPSDAQITLDSFIQTLRASGTLPSIQR